MFGFFRPASGRSRQSPARPRGATTPSRPRPRGLTPSALWQQIAGAVVLVGALVAAFCYWRGPGHPPGVLYDDGQYFELAVALRAGGYRHELMLPALEAVHFPPGYPAWLVLWDGLGRVIGLPAFTMWWLVVGNQLLVILGALCLYAVVVRYTLTRPWLVVGALLLGIVFPPAWILWNTLMSEALAFAVLSAALFAVCHMEALRREGRFPDRWALWGICAAATAGSLPLIRSIWTPVVLLVGWYLLRALRRQSWLWGFSASVLLMGPFAWWAVWASKRASAIPAIWAENYGVYTAFALPLWMRDGFVSAQWTFQLASAARIAGFLWAHPVAVGTSLALMVAGAIAVVRSRGWPVVMVAVGYLGLVAIWPFWPDRFLWGVAPFFAMGMAMGAAALWQWARSRAPGFSWGADVTLWLRSLVLAGLVVGTTVDWGRRMWPLMQAEHIFAPTVGRAMETYQPLVRYVRTLPTNVIVATGNDVLVRLWSGRPTVPLLPGEPGLHLGVPAKPLEVRLEASLCVAPRVVATYLRGDTLIEHALGRVMASGRVVRDTLVTLPDDSQVVARAVRCPAAQQRARAALRRASRTLAAGPARVLGPSR